MEKSISNFHFVFLNPSLRYRGKWKIWSRGLWIFYAKNMFFFLNISPNRHLCNSTLSSHFVWLFPPRLVRWGLRAGRMDISKILNSDGEPPPIKKTPPITHACFVCFFTALTGFTFLFIFPYRQLAEQREGDWLFIPASLRPAICSGRESQHVVFVPQLYWPCFPWCAFGRKFGLCVELFPLFISCFPRIFFEIWDLLTDLS